MTSAFERGMNELKRALRQTAEARRAASHAGSSRGNLCISGRANVIFASNAGQPGTTVAVTSQHAPIRQDRHEATPEPETKSASE